MESYSYKYSVWIPKGISDELTCGVVYKILLHSYSEKVWLPVYKDSIYGKISWKNPSCDECMEGFLSCWDMYMDARKSVRKTAIVPEAASNFSQVKKCDKIFKDVALG